MIFLNKVTRCIAALNYISKSTRYFCFRDKNFDLFRSKLEYKNSIIPLNKELNKYSIINSSLEDSAPINEQVIQSEVFFNKLTHRENVMKLTFPQLKDVLGLMASTNINPTKYGLPLKYLDEKCALSASRLPLDLSFYLLDAWYIILGPKVFKRHYYSAITSQWSQKIRKCSKSNLVLILYFVGLSKSAPPFLLESVLDRMENIISEFSDEEIALACLGFFKCSKRVDSKLFLSRCCQSAKNLLKAEDRFNSISILKLLRLSRYYDTMLLEAVKEYALKECKSFNLVECTNFLAPFTSLNIYCEDLFEAIENQVNSLLQSDLAEDISKLDIKTHASIRNRAKDFARFLWATASVGHPLKEAVLESFSQCIIRRLQIGEYEMQSPLLIDTLQSFVLANYYPVPIFTAALNASIVKKILNSDKAKPKYQLYFVEKSVTIDQPDIPIHQMNLFKPIPKNLNKDIDEREGFKDLITILESNFPGCFRSCYILPHIMIAGIFLAKPCTSVDTSHIYDKFISKSIISKQVYDMFKKNHDYYCIEILDPSVCAKESYRPLGLMSAKIRQLEKMGFKVVVFSSHDIANMKRTSSEDNINNENILTKLM